MRALALALLALVVLALAWLAGPAHAASPTAPRPFGPPAPRSLLVAPHRSADALAPAELAWLKPWLATPHHTPGTGFAYGGDAELRFHYDRVEGTADPDWLEVGRVSGFLAAPVAGPVGLVAETAYDRTTQKLLVERGLADVRLGRRTVAQAGILLLPLGASNLLHEAPTSDFADRSLVATDLLGAPASQLGVGVRGIKDGHGARAGMAYELDLVTGYDGGILTDAPDGTRLAAGRNTYGDNGGAFALTGRLAWPAAHGGESGVSAQAGGYRMTAPDGTPIDHARGVYVLEADAVRRIVGLDATGEAGFVAVDVPPGLEGLFAQTQWGASMTLRRTLREPIFRNWESSSLAGAVRAETVDFDRAVAGDSKQRVSASLAVRQKPWSVLRWTWYYEWRRDRFANLIPAAGLAFTAATYF